MSGSHVSFDTTKKDARTIRHIAERAKREIGMALTIQDVSMDLTACHANGCPLRLDELLSATSPDFGHDVLGIRRHLDRYTGTLRGNFVPRYARGD